MSKYNLERALRQELKVINNIIDQRIVKGLSYSREAKRHKFIVSSLENLRREASIKSGWFIRSFSLR